MSKPSNSRIKRFDYVKASELIDNERNWRKHPAPQRSALKDMLARIGFIDALVVRETPQGLEVIDGHLRKDIAGAQQVPVLVVDLDDDEALEALATLDPMAALAAPDDQMLEDLLADLINVGDEQLNEVLDALHDTTAQADPNAEWDGMPDFDNEGNPYYRTLIVHFDKEEDFELFKSTLDIDVSDSAKYIHYPHLRVDENKHLRYGTED